MRFDGEGKEGRAIATASRIAFVKRKSSWVRIIAQNNDLEAEQGKKEEEEKKEWDILHILEIGRITVRWWAVKIRSFFSFSIELTSLKWNAINHVLYPKAKSKIHDRADFCVNSLN